MHYYAIGVLAVSWAFWFWDTYLDLRQYKVYKVTEKVPDELEGRFNNETLKKAKAYSIDKARFSLISGLFSQIQFTLTIYYFLMPYFWEISRLIMKRAFNLEHTNSIEWEILHSLVFTFVTSLISTLISLPLSLYNTFVIEQRYGFNKQTLGFYAWDKVKMFSVSFVISAPVIAATVYIVRNGGQYFFLYLWLFCFLVVLVLTFFHGEIAALFDKFTPLPQGELRRRIEELATDLKFPLANIFVVEGSKRSAHSNAYQSGILNRKRIVIYDTLIEGYTEKNLETSNKDDESQTKKDDDGHNPKGCNNDEIIAVLCHELGHWYHSHLIKNLTFAEVNYFLMFLLFSKFYNDPTLYMAFGFGTEKPVVIGFALLMLILTPYNEFQGFISTAMSRRFEYQADAFAKKRGHPSELKTALVKLNTDNLNFPVHDELYSMFNHSHPTLIQRIRELSKVD